MRLGVVLLVPPPFDREIDVLRRACDDPMLGRVAPHVTLVPPVNVREEDLGAATALLREAAAASRPLSLELGPPVTFLPETPSLYLAVDGDVDEVRRLQELVLHPPLARPLQWPFVPHVTLVAEGTPERLEAAAVALADYRAEVTVDRLTILLESREDDGRRVWRPLADATLARPAVIGRGGLELELSVSGLPGPDVDEWLAERWERYSTDEYGPDWAPDEPLTLTARRGDRLVGVATGEVGGDDAYLAQLLVDPDVRGEGVGSHLLAGFTARAVEHGARRVTLRTLAGGAAERFYRDRGYVLAVSLPQWRRGRDFVQLARQL